MGDIYVILRVSGRNGGEIRNELYPESGYFTTHGGAKDEADRLNFKLYEKWFKSGGQEDLLHWAMKQDYFEMFSTTELEQGD